MNACSDVRVAADKVVIEAVATDPSIRGSFPSLGAGSQRFTPVTPVLTNDALQPLSEFKESETLRVNWKNSS